MKFEIKAGSEEFELKLDVDPTHTFRLVMLWLTIAISLTIFVAMIVGAMYGNYHAFDGIIAEFQLVSEFLKRI